MAKSQNPVAKLYETVIEDVINNVRESFLDDGVDDQVLQELKQIWEAKLAQTKAVDSPILGDRPARPQMYTYIAQTSGQQRAGQTVVYQTLPGQTVQLSGASQQARLAATEVIYQPQGGGLVMPTQSQLYTSYRPVVLGQPGVQIQQTRAAAVQGQPMVLTSVPQAGGSQQQTVAGKQQPSAIIQVDGSNEDQPSTSKAPSCCPVKIHQDGCRRNKLAKNKRKVGIIVQLDGDNGSSSSEDIDDDDNDDDDDDEEDDDDDEEETKEEEKPDEDPLCSDDDDSDQDATELFDTDNVVVCQYDKIHRAKAKWKFNLKVGIMNLKGKDQVFQKAVGEADW